MSSFLDWVNSQMEKDLLNKPSQDEIFNCKDNEYFSGSDQATIRIHKNYNGSGNTAFGGAQEWGAITLSIAIPVEISNDEGQDLLDDLRKVLENHNYKKA